MEDAYGVPRSPFSSDQEQDIADDHEMQELERQQHRQQPVPDDYAQTESGAEEGHEYDEETIECGVALGEAIASGSGAAGSSTQAYGDFQVPWRSNMRQYRNRPQHAGAKQQRKRYRAAVSEDGDGMDYRVERVATAFSARSSSGGGDDASADDDSEDTGNADAAATGPVTYVDAQFMTGFNAHHFGHCVTAKVPEFRHGTASNSTWMSYTEAKDEVRGMIPVRALCWNVPAELFSFDSTRFRHWTTPEGNPTRANNIASILSFCFTGTSKGFLFVHALESPHTPHILTSPVLQIRAFQVWRS